MELLGEQLSVGGGFSYAHHHHHHHHQPPSTLPPSTPLQFLSHHDPLSQELFTVVSVTCLDHRTEYDDGRIADVLSSVPSLAALSTLSASSVHKSALPLSTDCSSSTLPRQLPALLPVSVSHFFTFMLELCRWVNSLLNCAFACSPQVHASCSPKCGPHYQSRAGCGWWRGGELWGRTSFSLNLTPIKCANTDGFVYACNRLIFSYFPDTLWTIFVCVKPSGLAEPRRAPRRGQAPRPNKGRYRTASIVQVQSQQPSVWANTVSYCQVL